VAGVTALTLVVAGGAFAVYQYLGGGGPQPAEALPGSAIGYARIDLDPSAEQKVAALRLLRRFPEFEEATGISSDRDDLRRLIVEEFISDSGCDELSYDEDFAPWVGDRAGFAVMPSDDEPEAVVAVQFTDEAAAREAADAFAACEALSGDAATDTDDSEPIGIEFVGDYMLFADNQELAEDFAREAETAPLSEQDRFSDDMAELGDQGLASFWVDIDGLLKLPMLTSALEGEALAAALEPLHSYAGAFRAGSDHLELSLQLNSDIELEDEDDNPVVNLPDSTIGALSISSGGAIVDQYWDQIKAVADQMQPGAFDQRIATLEAESGLLLPEDLSTLLGDNVTAALDASGLSPDTLQTPEDFTQLNFGVRFTTDPEAIRDVVDRVQAKIDAAGVPFTFTTVETDDGMVVATNETYAETLSAEGELGDADAFETAVPDASDAEGVFYVDLDLVEQVVRDFGEAEAADQVAPLRAFGWSYHQGDSYLTETYRLTFD